MTQKSAEVLALDQALDDLARVDARKARVIELRFFGGLSVEETAEVLQISAQSVMRDWKLARAWLARELAYQPCFAIRLAQDQESLFDQVHPNACSCPQASN